MTHSRLRLGEERSVRTRGNRAVVGRSILAFGINDPAGVPARNAAGANDRTGVVDGPRTGQRPPQAGWRLPAVEWECVQVNHPLAGAVTESPIDEILVLRCAHHLG